MKTMSKITIGLVAATLLFVGCNNSANPSSNSGVGATVTEESLGLRKTDLYSEKSETQGDATHYGKSAAGSGYKIKRAFQDAPPMIPHDVEGMLPITINNNQCTGCHAPEVASSVGALPYPKSHMINFRPKSIAISGTNTSSANLKDISIQELSSLAGARFNCSQCHAPQSDSPAPENTFEAAYVREDGASKSTWSGTKLMEGIDIPK